MTNAQRTQEPQFLSGWKEIANYLGKGVRTVQRYERELGLPVRRPAGKPTGSVVATKVELDAWVAASPIREAFELAKRGMSADTGATDSMREGLEKMKQLRGTMVGLRYDLRASLDVLRQSLHELQGDLKLAHSLEKVRHLSVLERRDQTEYVFELLDLDSRRKAS